MLARPALVAAIFVALSLVASGGRPPGALAATFTVTKTADTNDGSCTPSDCSLREAIIAANSTPGADTVMVPAGTYTLTIPGAGEDMSAKGDLDILDDVTIEGAGAATTIIDANQMDRAFEIYPGVFVGSLVEFNGITIRNGVADYGAGLAADATGRTVRLTDVVISDGHATFQGGGISNHGDMVISGSVITGNRAASGPLAGGIFNSGTLTITDTTISGNSTDLVGGGIYNMGTLTVSGSTFSGNTAGDEGGAIANFGGTVTLTNSTFSGNSAVHAGGAIYSGAIGSQATLASVTLASDSAPAASEISHDNTGPFHLKNTIVAGATAGSDCAGTLTSDGHNISSDGTCGLTGPGDHPNVADPKMGPLADNGGPTQTHALLAGSPAIDAGSPDCPPPATDQRGVARPQGPACDIGAFELQAGQQVLWGDVHCDGAVDSVDSLGDLRHLAQLSPLPHADGCPEIGGTVEVAGASPHGWGDVDCDTDVNSIDALRILRYVAHLSLTPIAGCPDVGAEVTIS